MIFVFNTLILILFFIFGGITSYIDFKTKKVVVLYNYIYLTISAALIILFTTLNTKLITGAVIKTILFSTIAYAIIISLVFYFLKIGAGDSEFLWVISPTMLFFNNFNVFKLIEFYLSQLWISCILVIIFKIIAYFLSKKKIDLESKFAFVPFLFTGSILALAKHLLL